MEYIPDTDSSRALQPKHYGNIISLVHYRGKNRAHTELNCPFRPPRESFSALHRPDSRQVPASSAVHTVESEYYSRSGVESLHRRSAGVDVVGSQASVRWEVAHMQAALWRKARGFRFVVVVVVPRR